MTSKKTNESAGKVKDAGKIREKARQVERRLFRSYDLQHIGQTDRTWNILGLPILGTLLLCLAILLIIVGSVKKINDLIILGSLFLFGSLVFYVLMYIKVCLPMCQRNVVNTYDFSNDLQLDEVKETRPSTSNNFYYNATFEEDTEILQGKDRPVPHDNQLYGNKMRQFLGTPATTSNLKLYEDDEDDVRRTPLPPRLALPSDPNDSNSSVFTMDVEKEMAKYAKEMSTLELL